MSAPVSLTEAKLFLRVEHEAEDGLIQTLIDAAKARVEGEVGLSLTSTSAAPLRLAVMMMEIRTNLPMASTVVGSQASSPSSCKSLFRKMACGLL